MDRECNCSLPSKVNGKCVYEGKCRSRCIIYEVKYCMCDAIYIGKTQQTFKKRLHGHISDLQRLLKNGQKSDSFAAHFVQHFNNTTSRTDLRKCMTFKVIKQLNLIGVMKKFTKPNCYLCMQECLTILKMLRDKRVTVMNKNLELYGACRHLTTFHRFCLALMIPFLTGERVRPLKGFWNIMTWNCQCSFLNIGNNFQRLSTMKKLKLNRTLC